MNSINATIVVDRVPGLAVVNTRKVLASLQLGWLYSSLFFRRRRTFVSVIVCGLSFCLGNNSRIAFFGSSVLTSGLCVIGPDSKEGCLTALHHASVVMGYVELLR